MCPDRQQMMSCCCCHPKQKITFSRPKQKARLNTFSESTNTTFLVKPWRNGGFPYLNKRLCQVLRAWNSSSSWAWNSPDWRKVFFHVFRWAMLSDGEIYGKCWTKIWVEVLKHPKKLKKLMYKCHKICFRNVTRYRGKCHAEKMRLEKIGGSCCEVVLTSSAPCTFVPCLMGRSWPDVFLKMENPRWFGWRQKFWHCWIFQGLKRPAAFRTDWWVRKR